MYLCVCHIHAALQPKTSVYWTITWLQVTRGTHTCVYAVNHRAKCDVYSFNDLKNTGSHHTHFPVMRCVICVLYFLPSWRLVCFTDRKRQIEEKYSHLNVNLAEFLVHCWVSQISPWKHERWRHTRVRRTLTPAFLSSFIGLNPACCHLFAGDSCAEKHRG